MIREGIEMGLNQAPGRLDALHAALERIGKPGELGTASSVVAVIDGLFQRVERQLRRESARSLKGAIALPAFESCLLCRQTAVALNRFRYPRHRYTCTAMRSGAPYSPGKH
jgi:hypothetical protein